VKSINGFPDAMGNFFKNQKKKKKKKKRNSTGHKKSDMRRNKNYWKNEAGLEPKTGAVELDLFSINCVIGFLGPNVVIRLVVPNLMASFVFLVPTSSMAMYSASPCVLGVPRAPLVIWFAAPQPAAFRYKRRISDEGIQRIEPQANICCIPIPD
jgi:hypothetical protein